MKMREIEEERERGETERKRKNEKERDRERQTGRQTQRVCEAKQINLGGWPGSLRTLPKAILWVQPYTLSQDHLYRGLDLPAGRTAAPVSPACASTYPSQLHSHVTLVPAGQHLPARTAVGVEAEPHTFGLGENTA